MVVSAFIMYILCSRNCFCFIIPVQYRISITPGNTIFNNCCYFVYEIFVGAPVSISLLRVTSIINIHFDVLWLPCNNKPETLSSYCVCAIFLEIDATRDGNYNNDK